MSFLQMHNKFLFDFNQLCQRYEMIYYLAYVLKMLYPVSVMSDLAPICHNFSVFDLIFAFDYRQKVSAASIYTYIYIFFFCLD